MPVADLFIHSATVVTMAGFSREPARGEEMSRVGLIEDGGVAISQGKIVAVGSTTKLKAEGWVQKSTEQIYAGGKFVTPGFIDPHTHVFYAGSRENELALKLDGLSYLDILNKGGGILSTVRSTREASDNTIKEQTKKRMDLMLSMGTTTVEIKSGYGLSTAQELRALRLIREIGSEVFQDVVVTFLGAHAIPEGYGEKEYAQLVIKEMLPQVASERLAEFCDVFCEKGVFNSDTTAGILQRAKELGLKLKLHADELEATGGAELAARLKATSADHLLQVSDEGIQALSSEGVIAVLLPATSFNLAHHKYARAREMIAQRVPIALATDCNPGSSPTESMPLVLTLACLYLRLTPEQALMAATINAAHAVGRADLVGSLEVGKQADILILDVPNLAYLPYHFGMNPVQTVIKKGKKVWDKFQGTNN